MRTASSHVGVLVGEILLEVCYGGEHEGDAVGEHVVEGGQRQLPEREDHSKYHCSRYEIIGICRELHMCKFTVETSVPRGLGFVVCIQWNL